MIIIKLCVLNSVNYLKCYAYFVLILSFRPHLYISLILFSFVAVAFSFYRCYYYYGCCICLHTSVMIYHYSMDVLLIGSTVAAEDM